MKQLKPRKDIAPEPPEAQKPTSGVQSALRSAILQADELRALTGGAGSAPGFVQTSRPDGARPIKADREDLAGEVAAAATRETAGGEPLREGVRSRVEPHLGVDLGGVRVHSGPLSQLAAAGMGARAFTRGRQVHLGRGEHPSDLQLMGHELTHVAQQGAGRALGYQRLTIAGPHGPAEAEADAVAQEVSRGARRSSRTLSEPAGRALTRPAAGVVQRMLVANGDRAGFANLVNEFLDVQYQVAVSSAGVVSLQGTDVEGPPGNPPLFNELISVLGALIGDSNTTAVTFTHGKTTTDPRAKNVVIGEYASGMIDLDDLKAFGKGEAANAASTLIHELQEQYRKQVHSEVYQLAHASGIAAEERAMGVKRGDATMKQLSPTKIEATVPFTYPNGRVVNLIITLENNNIIDVTRKVVKEGNKDRSQ